MENFTPLQTLALAGLLQTSDRAQSFASSQSLLSAISRFGFLPLTQASQRCLNTNGSLVISAVKNLPGCLTGYVAINYRNNVPESYGINYNNLINSVLQQSVNISQQGTLGIIKIMRNSYDFCLNGYQTYKIISKTQQAELPKNTAGYLYSNLTDFATVGVSNQFGNLSSPGYKELCNNLVKFGTMFDVSDLNFAFTVQSMILNLFRQGFVEELVKVLNQEGISVSGVSTTQTTLLMSALNKLPKVSVKNILERTGYHSGSGKDITLITEVLDPKFAFGNQALALINNFDNLSKKTSAIFGQSTSMTYVHELGTALQSIRPAALNHLTALDNSPNSFKEAYSITNLAGLGQGSGIYGNPTVGDMLSSYSGIKYVSLIDTLVDSQTMVAETTEGNSLLSALEQAYQNRNDISKDSELASTINLAAQSLLASQQTSVIKGLNTGQDQFSRILGILLQEKKNLVDAGIDLNSIQGTINDAMLFVQNLPGLNTDEEQIGYGEFVRAICANNMYGEAIKAVMDEGFNQILLNSLGVEVKNTLIDTQPTGDQPGDSAQCCP